MKWSDASALIEKTLAKMNSLYGETLFDEWAVVRLGTQPATVLAYHGGREEDFKTALPRDAAPLLQEAADRKFGPGDFEFARFASGSRHDAGMMLGRDTYLLCNNTARSMLQLRESPLWISAQVPFVQMSEKFRSDPLVAG